MNENKDTSVDDILIGSFKEIKGEDCIFGITNSELICSSSVLSLVRFDCFFAVTIANLLFWFSPFWLTSWGSLQDMHSVPMRVVSE